MEEFAKLCLKGDEIIPGSPIVEDPGSKYKMAKKMSSCHCLMTMTRSDGLHERRHILKCRARPRR